MELVILYVTFTIFSAQAVGMVTAHTRNELHLKKIFEWP